VKSLHAWILLYTVVTLSLALMIVLAISDHVQRTYLYPVFESMDELELEQAREALHHGGADALRSYMQHLDQLFGAQHSLLDAKGVDVASGRSMKQFLPKRPGVHRSRGDVDGKFVITHQSNDGQNWFVAVTTKEEDHWTFLPYYLTVIGLGAATYWFAAISVVRPIGKITAALNRFGRSDLALRLPANRKDEIGVLAEGFNQMASRIETLVASERRLLTDISHELRSPLTRLRLAITLAEANPAVRANFDRVRRQVDRITSLVCELTELTRAEGDPGSRKVELVRLDEVVKEVVGDCQLEAQTRTCSIEVHGQAAATAAGDRELLRRALENVLRNAIRYSPGNSGIQCNLLTTDDVVKIAVRDYGPGVPAETLDRIFEPFYRVEEAREAESGGMGLGLAIAKRALALHKGVIRAENAHPGLLVTLTVPLAPASRPE
jgi:signal transduction histidine kinase